MSKKYRLTFLAVLSEEIKYIFAAFQINNNL